MMLPADPRAVRNNPQPQSIPDVISDPVIFLSLPLSLSSYACAMLGQHPQMYSLPETHLFLADTLRDWWDTCAKTSFNMSHGLVRTVAQLVYGEQNETTVQLARAWLRRRLPFTTGYILELLAERVHPRALVEKSPSMIFHLESMQRVARMFPLARFIHLVEHPRRHCEAVVAAIKEAVVHHPNRVPQWLRQLACFSAANSDESSQEQAELDPQQAWLALNKNIGDFFEAVPEAQKLLVRTEDVLRDPDTVLASITEWLAIRSDAEAIEAMKHPERSPYARFGPEGARYGDDAAFLRSPSLPADPAEPDDLNSPFSWRDDGEGFSPEVRALARALGYE
jgi:sulfotransferase family protein